MVKAGAGIARSHDALVDAGVNHVDQGRQQHAHGNAQKPVGFDASHEGNYN